MSKVLRTCMVLAVTAVLLMSHALMAADGVKGNLVTAQWLEKNLKSTDVLILDASSPDKYAAKHIPGAVLAPFAVVNIPFAKMDASAAEIETMYRAVGISAGKKIVIYDQGGDDAAPRLFFSLYYHGLPARDLYILDGGLAKWQADGMQVSSEAVPAKKNETLKIGKFNEDARANLPEVLTATGDPANNALIDALESGWHFGLISPFNRAGHIPNSVSLPRAELFNADKTFKSPEEIRKMLTYLGVKPEQQIYSYCGGGVAASVPFFAAKFIAGYPRVKLFPASEMGWLADERQLPYWTYGAPNLMKDSKWLQFWGGQMLRMYVGTDVSIVDVRPAEAYQQGHVPFALNIPGEAFREKDPAKLAAILGPAGVHVSDEAVVISGAGVTKESALAFVALERLGQKKVSVLTDSMDDWNKLGLKLSKDATAVGPKKGPYDMSIVPTTYKAEVRNEMMAASEPGAYPTVLIASGKELPAEAQAEKIVHVPYTDLLEADGKPKAAKEILTILDKAGVPHYARLVCISDDPGEAAVDYYILKLMGYPDVKVKM